LGSGSEGEEAAQGAVVLAVETVLETADVVEVAGLRGEVAEGEGGLGVVVFVRHIGFGGSLAELVADGGIFKTPRAELSPAGYGHGFDQVSLDGGGWLEFLLERAEKTDETVFGFVGEDDRSGEKTVF
jgi:hypothetical protein